MDISAITKTLSSLEDDYEKKVRAKGDAAQKLLADAQELKDKARELETQASQRLDHAGTLEALQGVKTKALKHVQASIVNHCASVSPLDIARATQAIEEMKLHLPMRTKLNQLLKVGGGSGALALALIARDDLMMPSHLAGVFESSIDKYSVPELLLIAPALDVGYDEIEELKRVQALFERVQADMLTARYNAPKLDAGANSYTVAYLSDNDWKLSCGDQWLAMKAKYASTPDNGRFKSAMEFKLWDLQQAKIV